jgi:6-phosphogluconate dehydrogenase
MEGYDIGVVGLGTMGQNLALNLERNRFRVAVYNRTTQRTEDFISSKGADKQLRPAHSIEELVAILKRPRTLVAMVKAGHPVDAVIEQLRPHLEAGDLIVDGGNSHFRDTERRVEELQPDGIQFLGVGISGGEEGALWGPSLMPGGPRQAYPQVEPFFTAIAAKAGGDPCVSYLGPGGAGHYVKMVHNGIEYGNMQLIAEAYDLLRRGLGLPAAEIQQVFARWNQGPLSSFLIEITADILEQVDPRTGQPLVEVILDVASQKGTGIWTSQEGLELGVPIPTITAAVEGRFLSAEKPLREAAAKVFPQQEGESTGDREAWIEATGAALYASTISSYAQGFALLAAASQAHDYGFDLGEIARIWRAGCIIRASLLEEIRAALSSEPDLPNLILAPFFREALLTSQAGWRQVVQAGAGWGIPLPAMGASLAAFDSFRSARLPANLIQAQRDYFGAHTYRRVDREGSFHTDWSKAHR